MVQAKTKVQETASQSLLRAIFANNFNRLDSLTGCVVATEFIERIPITFARQNNILALQTPEPDLIEVAIGDEESLQCLDVIGRFLGKDTRPIYAPAELIRAEIDRAYEHRTSQTESLIQSLDINHVISESDASDDLLDGERKPPVIQLVNQILFEAVKSGASDVHVQPYEDCVIARMRIDGVLFDAVSMPKDVQDEVTSRIKVIGKMDIAEKRLAQDGRATVKVGERVIDLRISSLPTSFGERIVLRLLDKSARLYTLNELGMHSSPLSRFRELIRLEHGLILVTGPTGSGKSTTLYGALQEVNVKTCNVVTLEDPIEYQLEGVSQTQISGKKGMTFASGLRTVLRQDPDIIMVGEIRDQETAVMAIQSALTGHLVFSTLHTNDASSAITRLLDLGIEPYLVASSVVAVLAQRLVRKVCDNCGKEAFVDASQFSRIGVDCENSHISSKIGQGCAICRQTGYRGRIGLFELLVINDQVRDAVQQTANASTIRKVGVENGMELLNHDGIRKINHGLTTIDEVARVTMRQT